jgi:hypothetical protein
MSSNNNAASLVPILDGTNYRQWSVAMKAFIMSTGLWAYIEGHIERESLPERKEGLAKLSDSQKEEIHVAQYTWCRGRSPQHRVFKVLSQKSHK